MGGSWIQKRTSWRKNLKAAVLQTPMEESDSKTVGPMELNAAESDDDETLVMRAERKDSFRDAGRAQIRFQD